MKYTKLNTYVEPAPQQSRKKSHFGLVLSLLLFGGMGVFIGNYLIQNTYTAPEDTKASSVFTCQDGIYDNFDDGEFDIELWKFTPHYQVVNGGIVRLYDNENWQGVYSTDRYSEDFSIEVDISDLTYINDGAALLLAEDDTGLNRFYMGLHNKDYALASFSNGEQIGGKTGKLRSKTIRSVKIVREGASAKFYYVDDRGQAFVDQIVVYEGDVHVGVSTGSFGDDEYVTARFDNFTLSCPRNTFSDLVD